MGITKLEQPGQLVWKKIQPLALKAANSSSAPMRVLTGALWGLLPCGLVYSVLIWTFSSSHSAAQGAMTMLCFGLGTCPAMILASVGANRVYLYLQHRSVRSIAGVLMILAGLATIVPALGFHP
jgi:sulfite exporter TauE/SafE